MNPNVLMLLGVTLVWGTTFPLLKAIAVDLSGVEISAIRFVLAAVCLLPFLRKTSRAVWRDGALLGGFALISYVAQAYGLQHISSNRSAFLTSLNVLMVPLLGFVFGRGLSWNALVAALLACLGIGLMSWEGGGNLRGDSATVLSALAYALYVIFLSQRAGRHDSRQLAATQITLMAVFGCVWMVASADTRTLVSLPVRMLSHLPALIYLGVVASAGMLFLQALAQRHVSAEKAAIVYAMEPVFAALFGWLWLSESLGVRGALGGVLVVMAMILSELRTASAVCTQD
ncbi:MAG: DMT family transporter [Formivibrio sp.]|nr:DMT family transporter [Formivibrio sp.]